MPNRFFCPKPARGLDAAVRGTNLVSRDVDAAGPGRAVSSRTFNVFPPNINGSVFSRSLPASCIISVTIQFEKAMVKLTAALAISTSASHVSNDLHSFDLRDLLKGLLQQTLLRLGIWRKILDSHGPVARVCAFAKPSFGALLGYTGRLNTYTRTM
ncbi:hypothetical protein BDZ89DRAFT_89206 [Hymenopellis radicata]|nr:hypothetical protein BDZ89DRAFT_89206 [Hymenopellis radicata]